MTIDEFRNNLLLVSVNGRDIVSTLSALGDLVSVSEVVSLLGRVPTLKFNLDNCEQGTKDLSNLSDSDAESILNIIKGLVPDVAKAGELMIQKRDAFALLPNIFSIEGLFVVPSIVGGSLIRLLRAQMEGAHAQVAAITNATILLLPSNYTAEAKSVKAQLDLYFQQAISAYSS